MSLIHVEVYVKRSAACDHADDIHWKRCRCPKWLYWAQYGRRIRKSAKTRAWDKAVAQARLLEAKFDPTSTAVSPAEKISLAKAIDAYLADKKSQKIGDEWYGTIERTLKEHFLPWSELHGVYLLTDVTLPKLQKFRATWTFAGITASKVQERLRSFFQFCVDNGWCQTNPVRGLSHIKVRTKPTCWFNDEEFQRLIDATFLYDQRHKREAK